MLVWVLAFEKLPTKLFPLSGNTAACEIVPDSERSDSSGFNPPPTWHSGNPWLIVAISIPLFDICDCLDSHLGFGLVSAGSQNLWNKSRISSIGRCQYILGRNCAVGKPDFSQLSAIKWPLWFGRSFRWLQASKFHCNIVLGWGQWRWEDAAARLIHAT